MRFPPAFCVSSFARAPGSGTGGQNKKYPHRQTPTGICMREKPRETTQADPLGTRYYANLAGISVPILKAVVGPGSTCRSLPNIVPPQRVRVNRLRLF